MGCLDDCYGGKVENTFSEQHVWRLGEAFRGQGVKVELVVTQTGINETRSQELFRMRGG